MKHDRNKVYTWNLINLDVESGELQSILGQASRLYSC